MRRAEKGSGKLQLVCLCLSSTEFPYKRRALEVKHTKPEDQEV